MGTSGKRSYLQDDEKNRRKKIARKKGKEDASFAQAKYGPFDTARVMRMLDENISRFSGFRANPNFRLPYAIHAKLEISQPEDSHERQADEVAHAFVNGNIGQGQDILSSTMTEISREGEGNAMTTSPAFDRQLQQTKGQGQKLDEGTKSELEEHTGADLSGVNVHTGSEAHTMSGNIQAKAFTHGQDIYFKDGEYDPQSQQGKQLLAHEVTHTVQQGNGVQAKIQRQPDEPNYNYTIFIGPDAPDSEDRITMNIYIYEKIFNLTEEQVYASGIDLSIWWTPGKFTNLKDLRNTVHSFAVDKSIVDLAAKQNPAAAKGSAAANAAHAGKQGHFDTLDQTLQSRINTEANRRFTRQSGVKRELTQSSDDATYRDLWNNIRDEIIAEHEQIEALPQRIKDVLLAGGMDMRPDQYPTVLAAAEKLKQLDELSWDKFVADFNKQPHGGGAYDPLRAINTLLEKYQPQPEELTAQETNTVDRLEGTEELYRLYTEYQSKKEAYDLNSRLAHGEQRGEVPNPAPVLEEFNKKAPDYGFTGIVDYGQAVSDFVGVFQKQTRATALTMLSNSQQVMVGELHRYGYSFETKASPAPTADVDQMLSDFAPYNFEQRFTEADAKFKAGYDWEQQYGTPQSFTDEGAAITEGIKADINTLSRKYPILGYYISDGGSKERMTAFRALVASGKQTALDKFVGISQVISGNIQTARERLIASSDLIWDLDQAKVAAKTALGIMPGSVYDLIITDHKIALDHADSIKDMFMGIVQAALAILAASGVGTPIAILAGVAGVGIGAYQAYEDYQEYEFQSAAYQSSVDRAMALSSEEPSLFFLAMDIVFTVFDAAQAAKLFSKLAVTARAMIETASEDTIKAFRDSVEQEAKNLFPDSERHQKSFIKRMTSRLDDPKFLEDLARQSKERQALIEANPQRVAELKKLYPGITDLGLTGALRMEQYEGGAMAKVLEKTFEKSTEALRTLYAYAGLYDNFAEGLGKLFKGLAEADFSKVVSHYMLARSTEGRSLLRHLTEMELTADNFATIASSIQKGKVSSSTIIELMAQKIGGGKEGYLRMLEISEEVHPKQQGTFFEQWYKTNFTSPELRGGETVKLSNGKNVILDNSFSEAGKNVIVELKNYLSGATLEGEPLAQLYRYKSVLQENPGRFSRIEYVFTTKEAAESNLSIISSALEKRGKVFYIDDAGIKQALTKQ